MDAVFFQVRNGAAEILRSRTPVTAGPRQHIGHLFGCELANIEPGLPVYHEGQRTNLPVIGLHADPAGEVIGRLHRHLSPNQLAKLPLQILRCEPEQHALALATSVERHHQAGLLSAPLVATRLVIVGNLLGPQHLDG